MISLLLALALTASDASATTTTTTTATTTTTTTAAVKPKPEADPMVCRSESELGSNLPHRVCRRQSDIDARAAQDRQTLERIQAGTPVGSSH